MSSTFSGLQIGKTGLTAAMSALQVTGNNISNVNSKGYTRQKVDTTALGAYNGTMRYCTDASNYKGLGVRVMGTTQYRDESLDVRYRQEAAKLSQQSAASEGLTELGGVFDDAVNTVLDNQISSLVTQLQTYASAPTDSVSENLVKTASEVITQFFNQYADRVNTSESDLTSAFTTGVDQTNSMLEQISSLNDSIRNAEIGGYEALELKDKRNNLLDELSQYMNIQVGSKTLPIGSGQSVEELTVDFVDANGKKFSLIDGGEHNKFEITGTSGNYGLNLTKADGSIYTNEDGTTGTDIDEKMYNGAFRGYVDVLDGKGTFAATGENDYKGIPYYRNMLDTLAKNFADVMNTANKAADGSEKPLFESSVAGEAITASNIRLATDWANSNSHYLTNTKVTSAADNDTDNTNILYMISQLTGKHDFEVGNGTDSVKFNGTFQDLLTNMSTTLGTQIKANDTLSTTYKSNMDDIEYARQSASGVSLDEEAVNMITYNYALTAASRFLTTVDDSLGTLISSTGMVGR